MSVIMTEKPFFTSLPERGLIHVEGGDRHDFLQGLVTNDVKALKPGVAVYACLLTAQGKFLHDFFMMEGDGVILLDCEGGARAQDLYKRLSMYRLRADVQISVEETVPVYATLGKAHGMPDPRHPDMGYRSFEKPEGMEERSFEEWDRRRIMLRVPDGSRDMEVGKSTLLEYRIDALNGVSFDKGCYVGQELTARMHYRGLAKKHLYVVQGQEQGQMPQVGEDIRNDQGQVIGRMGSSCDDVGLALIKDREINGLHGGLTVILDKSPS